MSLDLGVVGSIREQRAKGKWLEKLISLQQRMIIGHRMKRLVTRGFFRSVVDEILAQTTLSSVLKGKQRVGEC
jgi:hypothetical protein